MEDSEKLQKISDLIHQLRQPLNIISLSCGNIKSRLKSPPGVLDSEYAVGKMARVENSIQEASILINEIEFLSKKK